MRLSAGPSSCETGGGSVYVFASASLLYTHYLPGLAILAAVWFWRHTHDTSPAKFVTGLEDELSQGRRVVTHEFLPYSQLERWVLRIVRGPHPPAFFYHLLEVR